MTGDLSRTDQFVNNSGGTVQFDVPMTYTGNTILNPGPLLRVSAKNALDATGDLIFAGGQLRVDSASGQNRMIAPISIANDIVMTADTTIQMENSAYEMYLAGNISLAPNSTGIARTLNVGNDQPGGRKTTRGYSILMAESPMVLAVAAITSSKVETEILLEPTPTRVRPRLLVVSSA